MIPHIGTERLWIGLLFFKITVNSGGLTDPLHGTYPPSFAHYYTVLVFQVTRTSIELIESA
jgi:hypothetical protein